MSNQVSAQKRFLNTRELAAIYGTSEKFWWNRIYAREVESVKVGRLRKVSVEAAERYLESRTIPALEVA